MGNFSDHIVNQRFKKVFHHLEDRNLIKGKSDIAKKLGTYNHVINSILKGQRNITVDQLLRLFENYGLNANYLFGQSDQMFREDSEQGDLPVRSLHERRSAGRRNITLVPERAMAGYATEYQDDTYWEQLQRFSLPHMEGSDLVAFEISGDSMLPTITSGDIVVCEPVERGGRLYDNHVYVVVTDIVVAKRIQQIKNGESLNSLRLISDNGNVYKPYEISPAEIRQLLKVRCRLTDYAIS